MNKKHMLETMKIIREFETEIGEAVLCGEIKTPCHLYIGQEAVAVGVCEALRKTDVVYSTHRGHGHYIAKGGNIDKLRDEIYGKETGCTKGKGGSMHLKDPEVGFMLSSPIVGGTIPLAVGSALAFKMLKKDSIAVAFLGDGATNEGVFWESLNFSALYKLPIIFVVENNGYATHLPYHQHSRGSILCKANEFKIMVKSSSNNVNEIYWKTKDMVYRARNGFGPQLLEVETVRECGHVGMIDERKM